MLALKGTRRDRTGVTALLAISMAFVLAADVGAEELPRWPDTILARTQLLALEQTLNAELLASRSATTTLENWCRTHEIAAPARIVALLDRSIEKEATHETRGRLDVGPEEPVRFRHVRLSCGERVLSEADNWYVPGRLTGDINRLLETTDTPFGKAVQPLQPTRQTFDARVLWSPLPAGWEMGGVAGLESRTAIEIADVLFVHRAVLYDSSRRPISEVHEFYQRGALEFRPTRK